MKTRVVAIVLFSNCCHDRYGCYQSSVCAEDFAAYEPDGKATWTAKHSQRLTVVR